MEHDEAADSGPPLDPPEKNSETSADQLTLHSDKRLSSTFRSLRDSILAFSADVWATLRGWSLLRTGVVVAAFLIFISVTFLVDVPSIATLRSWADSAGAGFILIFCLLYIGLTQFPLPRSVLTLSSGILFGPYLGSIVALGCTTISAIVSLIIVRRLLGEWMHPRLTHPAVVNIDRRLRQRGWLAVGSLRMIAAVPFSILNYVAALTSIPVIPFAVATLIGSAPGTIVTVSIGDALSGGGSLRLVFFSVTLAMIGCIGIVVDQRLPVKSGK